MGSSKRRVWSRAHKRRYYGNQHEKGAVSVADKPESTSASARKLEAFSGQLPEELRWAADCTNSSDEESSSDSSSDSCYSDDGNDSDVFFLPPTNIPDQSVDPERSGNRLIDLEVFQTILGDIATCKHCCSGLLSVREVRRDGLVSTLEFSCTACSKTSSFPLGKLSPAGRFYEVNRRAVTAMRLVGRGLSALKKICCSLNMPPPMAKTTYASHHAALSRSAIEVAQTA